MSILLPMPIHLLKSTGAEEAEKTTPETHFDLGGVSQLSTRVEPSKRKYSLKKLCPYEGVYIYIEYPILGSIVSPNRRNKAQSRCSATTPAARRAEARTSRTPEGLALVGASRAHFQGFMLASGAGHGSFPK